jgi:YD repeat-containing protein
MFGDSWRSNYEESLQTLPNSQVKYWRGDGSAWTFTWNSTTQAYAITYPTNEYVTLTFKSSTTLFTLTYKNGNKEIFTNAGTLTALVDRNGNQTSLSYGSNRLVQVTGPVGNSLSFTYGNSSFPAQVTSIQDTVGTVAKYTYATGGYLTSTTYADGSVINYTSDPNGLIINVTDANGKTLESHTYNSLRQGLTSSKANGVDALSVTYGPSGTPILTDSLGNVTTYSVGQRTARRSFIGSIAGSGCDSCGGRGNYSYDRDSVGNLWSVTDPLGHWTGYTYDSNGNILTKKVTTNSQGTSYQAGTIRTMDSVRS